MSSGFNPQDQIAAYRSAGGWTEHHEPRPKRCISDLQRRRPLIAAQIKQAGLLEAVPPALLNAIKRCSAIKKA